jgi:hypothetical protein
MWGGVDSLICLPAIMGKVELLQLLFLLKNPFNFLCKRLVPNLFIVEVFGAFRSIVDNFSDLMQIMLDKDLLSLVQPYLRLIHVFLTRFRQRWSK